MLPEQRTAVIYQQLQASLHPQQLDVIDESYLHVGHSGHQGAGHFAVTIVADCFRGQSLVARHRMVYSALAGLMGKEIHALRIDAKVVEE